MSTENQIDIKSITYEEERLYFFVDQVSLAQKRYDRLYKTFKDAPYLSEGTQFLSDAGRELQFYKDVVEMLDEGYRKQSENVIELPCRVGETLYVISQIKDKRILPFINEYEVTSIGIKKKGIIVYHEMDGYIKSFKQTDFGKTVFLTKEEAEQAVNDIYVGCK